MKLHATPQYMLISSTSQPNGESAFASKRTRQQTSLHASIHTVFATQKDNDTTVKQTIPSHIEALLTRQEQIKKQISEYKEQLTHVKSRLDMDEKIKTTLVKHLTDYLTQLQIQLVSVSQALHEALKKSGISDLNQLVDVLS
ncbi:hypothetical protein [Pseudoalteromonas sp. MMG022]|uniref:hypothetical protein n=1 Tax=Pseudoalteromonas sp. MMG022 TaxID=2909978 RepID=UPI001F2A3B95|nr:hypothetical protein [Pseudoalteromonas sp. MMG022]MCF6434477.1 hypothetical protein [Pseudoalteromonas sp. MMG022]